MLRRRITYCILFILIIPIGLSTRKYGAYMPGFIAEYGGDVLYATCWFFFMRMLLPGRALWQVVLYACLICYLIEVLELYQAPWVVHLRHTPPFGLILGYGFKWSDMFCYTIGALLGWGTGLLIERKRVA